MFKKTMMALCAAAVAMMFTGCGEKKESGILAKVKKSGKLVVYTNPDFPPYEYMGENGAVAGVEMELVEKIGEKLGAKVEFVPTEFDSILMSVVTGKADLGASGFTINEERKKKVDFSHPFVVSVQYVIVAEKSSVKTVEDLAGKSIGCQQGTTGCLMIEDAINKGILKDKGSSLKSYNLAPDAVLALQQNKVDAVVIDELVAISLTNANTGLKTFALVAAANGKGLIEPEEFGMILPKGNDDLMAIINDVIDTAKKDGSLQASFDKHRAITEKKK